ncbi:MAG: ferredoxin [Bacilli bacterium]|nr:ferredoxin [Bacilli bacterium]
MIKIDNERCLKCGSCVASFPEILFFNDEAEVEAKENITEEELEQVKEFIESQSCPVDAIKEVKEEEKKED